LNVLFVRALAARLGRNPPVIVNAVNPGFCLSNLRSGASGFQAFFDRLMEKALARTTEEGARQLVWAALGSENGKELDLSGEYISDMAVETPHKFVSSKLGKMAQDKLWVG
jgi:NAD(P)-dependent dehydrogenase (short-subunit alcohol dehydrogenase family)